jgi:hypothetical protein
MAAISIRNIVKHTNDIQDLMTLSKVARASRGSEPYEDLAKNIKNAIHPNVISIEKILARQGITPAGLSVRSRRAYQWLKYLDNHENLDTHLDSLQRIILYLPTITIQPKYKKYKVEFAFFHLGSLYQIRRNSSHMQITVQESFTTAPDKVLIALLESALGKPVQTTRLLVQEFTFSSGYRTAREKLEYLGIPQGGFASGSVHDLRESFSRVNRSFFNGEISRPHLTWNNRLTVRKFGHYQWDTDTVMVSRTLDQHQVPEYVVDFVMYHELLHKKLGARLVNSRRMAHTRKFRQLEAQYPRYQEAQKYLNKISQKRN